TYIANTAEPDPEAESDIVHGDAREMKYRGLQVNSFGFGGQNASVVLTRD
ncbi:MAG: 3-oxoacyl-ACP synthase, partial [Alphaproteobacteria bacterium]|nr:3-oxoacyl-ACP synthase [Alphaproteobacteria bacterium]